MCCRSLARSSQYSHQNIMSSQQSLGLLEPWDTWASFKQAHFQFINNALIPFRRHFTLLRGEKPKHIGIIEKLNIGSTDIQLVKDPLLMSRSSIPSMIFLNNNKVKISSQDKALTKLIEMIIPLENYMSTRSAQKGNMSNYFGERGHTSSGSVKRDDTSSGSGPKSKTSSGSGKCDDASTCSGKSDDTSTCSGRKGKALNGSERKGKTSNGSERKGKTSNGSGNKGGGGGSSGTFPNSDLLSDVYDILRRLWEQEPGNTFNDVALFAMVCGLSTALMTGNWDIYTYAQLTAKAADVGDIVNKAQEKSNDDERIKYLVEVGYKKLLGSLFRFMADAVLPGSGVVGAHVAHVLIEAAIKKNMSGQLTINDDDGGGYVDKPQCTDNDDDDGKV